MFEGIRDARVSAFDRIERSIYVENYGCTANKFDLEIMLTHLINAGYRIVDEAELADILLINTCGVKKPTEDRMLERLRLFSRLNKPLIIAGCLPKINLSAIRRAAPQFSVAMDPYSIDKILFAVSDAENGEKNKLLFSDKPIIKLEQPKMRFNEVVEIVQIAEGCAGSCSFCCVRFARGGLFSYPEERIVERIIEAVSKGAKEIWITSQDNGAYGLDIKKNLASLLERCCEIKGEFMIRVGMMNPAHVTRMLHPLMRVYKNHKIFKFLHLPLQSGDNEVLRLMNRFYSVEDFIRIVSSFRKEVPNLTLATDIICGFPGENKEAFERTINLLEEVQPDIVNISKFFPRPGTPAEKMRQLTFEEVKDRSRRLMGMAKRISLERNAKWINWKGEVLIDEKGKGASWVGRNFAYKPIIIKSGENLLGKLVNVRVVNVYPTYLEAKILK